MDIKESPVVEEYPVRRPATIQENAFFYYGQNREYLRGTTDKLDAAIPIPPTTAMNRLMVWGGLGALSALVVSIANPWALLVFVGIVIALGLIAPRLTRRNHAYLTEKVAREGYFLTGTLLRCVAVATGERYIGFQVEAVYEFLSPTSTPLQGTMRQARPDLSGVQLPTPGTPVYVLYFNDSEFYLL